MFEMTAINGNALVIRKSGCNSKLQLKFPVHLGNFLLKVFQYKTHFKKGEKTQTIEEETMQSTPNIFPVLVSLLYF